MSLDINQEAILSRIQATVSNLTDKLARAIALMAAVENSKIPQLAANRATRQSPYTLIEEAKIFEAYIVIGK